MLLLLEIGRRTGIRRLAQDPEGARQGLMTFVVDQQGIVFQKDLGAETAMAAAAITTFDPDESWEPTGD